MECRKGCAACCVNISISSPIPGMSKGKPASIRCIHLNKKNLCAIHDTKEYPEVCRNFTPMREMCGNNRKDAQIYLMNLENLTK